MSKRRTGIKNRLKLYQEQANKLRIAWICCDNSLVPPIIDELIRLNRKFEGEDNPHEGH